MLHGQSEIIHMKLLSQCLAYRKNLAVFIINGAYDQKAKCAAHISVTALYVILQKDVFFNVGDISCLWLAGS